MNHSLKPWNILDIERSARTIVRAEAEQQLLSVWQTVVAASEPMLIPGEGSSVLFLNDYAGTVILNRIIGIEVSETPGTWCLHVGAGENWHQLVQFTLQRAMPGLENLALAPGCVGPSPIQNIGAYGVELQRVCNYVDCIEPEMGREQRLSAVECRFGYRDSIFKHEYQDRYAVVVIGLTLAKAWQSVLSYGDLTCLDPQTVTPQRIFDSACHIRMTKLPNPKINDNAGSFFRNPIINAQVAEALLTQFPQAPHYPQANGTVKLAAGWLID